MVSSVILGLMATPSAVYPYGEPKEDMMRVIRHIAPRMPVDKPRYLMGVGTPQDLVESVYRGVDMLELRDAYPKCQERAPFHLTRGGANQEFSP